jgi:hypothetical protein
MFNKILLALSATALVAVPATAQAHQSRSAYYGQSYNQGYSGSGYGYNGYPQVYYGQTYNGGYQGRTYGYNGTRRCKGTTGLIVGGAAGAVLGSRIAGSTDAYGYRRGSSTTGAIIGGALGALAGRSVEKSNCRNRY